MMVFMIVVSMVSMMMKLCALLAGNGHVSNTEAPGSGFGIQTLERVRKNGAVAPGTLAGSHW